MKKIATALIISFALAGCGVVEEGVGYFEEDMRDLTQGPSRLSRESSQMLNDEILNLGYQRRTLEQVF